MRSSGLVSHDMHKQRKRKELKLMNNGYKTLNAPAVPFATRSAGWLKAKMELQATHTCNSRRFPDWKTLFLSLELQMRLFLVGKYKRDMQRELVIQSYCSTVKFFERTSSMKTGLNSLSHFYYRKIKKNNYVNCCYKMIF